MLARRILVIAAVVLAGFSGGRSAQAGVLSHINQAMRWTGWGYSDGYHSRQPGWSEEYAVPMEETVPTPAPQVAPPEPKPAGAPRSTRLPRNILQR